MIDTGRRSSTDVPRNFRLPTVSKNSTKGSLSVRPDPKSLKIRTKNSQSTKPSLALHDFELPFPVIVERNVGIQVTGN